jgi:transcription antitermination factor NusG
VAQEWLAVRTKSRREKVVASNCKAKGYRVLLPLYREKRCWSGRHSLVELPLFSGYIFVELDPELRLPILQTPGVVHIVGTRQGPVPMDKNEIQNIERIVRAEVPVKPWPFLSSGQVVEIASGPLASVQGILVSQKNEHRLVVSVTLLQRALAVEIDTDCIRPIPSRRPPSEIISPLKRTAVA